VAENLLAGRPEVSAERLEEVLGLVGLREVVLALPAGLESELTPRGAPLSRTEQRRLILARALLGEPRLMVIDELLDGATDEEFHRLFAALQSVRGRTTVVVFTQEDRVAQRFALRLSMEGGRLARG
jgi:ABC-type multidrug transport system fused ATPase/permease subunit